MPLRPIGVLLILAASVCAQQPSPQPPKPQTVFHSPDRWTESQSVVAQPIPIPPRVLELLKQDPLFLTIVEHLNDHGLTDQHDFKQDHQQDWLVASEIDLGCTRGVLVAGQGPLRAQSHMSPFWIFAANRAGEYLPPLAVVADRIQVRSHWLKGCNEIRAGVSSPGPTFRVTRFNLKSARFVRGNSWTENPDGSFFPKQELKPTPFPPVHREANCPGTGNPPPADSRTHSCG